MLQRVQRFLRNNVLSFLCLVCGSLVTFRTHVREVEGSNLTKLKLSETLPSWGANKDFVSFFKHCEHF